MTPGTDRRYHVPAAIQFASIFAAGTLAIVAAASSATAQRGTPVIERKSITDRPPPEKSAFCTKEHILPRLGGDVRSPRRGILPGVSGPNPVFAWMLKLAIQDRTGERQFIAEFFSHVKFENSALMQSFENVFGPPPASLQVSELTLLQCPPMGDAARADLPIFESLVERSGFFTQQFQAKLLMVHYNSKTPPGKDTAPPAPAGKDVATSGPGKDGSTTGPGKDGAVTSRLADAEPGLAPPCREGDVICERAAREREEEDLAPGPRDPRDRRAFRLPLPPPYVPPPPRDYALPTYELIKAPANVRSGNTVVVLEDAKCSKEGNFLLAYRGRALSTAADNVDVLVEKRFGLNNYVNEQGPGGERVSDKGYLCAPRREICYGEVDFSAWNGQISKESVISFARADLVVQEKPADNDDLVSIFKHFLTLKCGKASEPPAKAK